MPKTKLSPEQIDEIRQAPASTSNQVLAARFGVHRSQISRARRGVAFGAGAVVTSSMREIPTDQVMADPRQPRKTFDDAELHELASSIRVNGLLQPIAVRENKAGGGFVIVAGERRWRAHLLIGKPTILARVIEIQKSSETRVLQLIENSQRANVSPLEEANAYAALLAETGWTVEHLASQLGMQQPWRINERLNLLKLKSDYQQILGAAGLSPSQAQEMSRLSAAGQDALFRAIKAGRCPTYGHLRTAANALEAAERQPELMAMPLVSACHREAASAFETRFTKICKLLAEALEADEAKAVRTVDPGRADTVADMLLQLQRDVQRLEMRFREVAAQAELAAAA